MAFEARSDGAPVAIIDIGSNSVRLVIYEDHHRAPTPLYNEKLMCGLGRGVVTTHRLPGEAVSRALEALARFRVLCETAGVGTTRVLATAAARDAENGPAFLDQASAACGSPVELLTGEREAKLSALGVVSGFNRPDGIVGDLGGGSLELVDVRDGSVGEGITLPLGGLVLHDRTGGVLKNAARIVRDELARATQLPALAGRTFYAVGGTWRALARMQMGERGYPLHVMHGYDFDLRGGGFVRLVEQASTDPKRFLRDVAEARRPLLAYGAAVLDEIVRLGRPARVTVSALGVREGLLYEALDPAARREDPLLSAARELNRLRSRSPLHGEELIDWTDAFVASLDDNETEDEARLRRAACLLSDVAWRAHPDYRGDQSFALIAHASLLGVDHPGRAYLGLAISFRHNGLSLDGLSPAMRQLAGPRLLERARLLAALLRIAYPLTVAMAGVLPAMPLTIAERRIVLRLPPARAALASERLSNRLRALGRLLDRETTVEIA